jgi:hypothetical protein
MEGGAAGSVNKYNIESNTEQQWTVTVPSLLGDIQYTHNSQDEFYNGELSGSHLVVTTQSLSGSDERLSFTEAYPNLLFNNVTNPRPNPYIQDVDYSFGATVPVNNGYLLSGSATRGTVPVSNYTTKRIVNPRYDGVKNTSTQLNVWTSSSLNEGNYGKTPSMESLKTAVAYCESIPGWPPEHIDASSANIIYLIHADGTVTKPNVSENSLEITQGNFISGERVVISYSNTGGSTSTVGGTDQNLPSREIIRGGARIEPILYNQKGWNPPSWEPTIEFQNWARPAVGDYTRLNEIPNMAGNKQYPYTSVPALKSYINPYNELLITQQMADDGVTLTMSGYIWFGDAENSTSVYNTILAIAIYIDNTQLDAVQHVINAGDTISNTQLSYTYTLTPSFIKSHVGQTFKILSGASVAVNIFGTIFNPNLYVTGYKFQVTQYPLPAQQPTISVPSNIWVSASNGSYSMYTTQSDMVNMFTTNLSSPTWYMKNISGSDYNPILTPWGIERGDVFRFEGDESKTYMVNYVENFSEGGSPAVTVYFGAPLPSSLNINRYSLVRYVDDASKVVLKGYRPSNSTGPYIVRPEYVVPELNKGIDEFIVDLTQKGLL